MQRPPSPGDHRGILLSAATPLGVPDDPSGVLRLGLYLDNQIAANICQLTKLGVPFVRISRIVGSSLPKVIRAALSRDLDQSSETSNSYRLDPDKIWTWQIDTLRCNILKRAERKCVGHVIRQASREATDVIVARLRRLCGLVAAIGFVIALGLTLWDCP